MSAVPSAPNPSTALARVVVDELVRCGVRHLVLAPGSRSSALAIAAAEHPRLRLWVQLDERSAGFFALGVGKATGTPAAVVTTSGTAVANLFPAVVEADAAAAPLLVLSADRPPELRHAGANQTIDQVKLFGDTVRWFCEMGVAEDRPDVNPYWRSTVDRAVAEARGERGGPAGPVHLNLAFREPLVPVADDGRSAAAPFAASLEGRANGQPWTAVAPAQPTAEQLDLGDARRPLVVVGDGRSLDIGAVLAAGIPVIAEAASSHRVPGTVSTAHHLLSHPGFRHQNRPDLVITVGRVGLSPQVSTLVTGAPRHLAVAAHGWPDPARDASSLTTGLDGIVPSPQPEPGWSGAWQEAEQAARAALDDALDRVDQVSEPRTARDTAAAVPPGGLLVAGSSMPVRDLDWFMAPRSLQVVANRGASGIDGIISTAFGARAGTDAPTVGLVGDLSLLHDQNGLLLAERPDLVLVVVNNDGGGIFSFLPQARHAPDFERLFGTPHGRDVSRLAHFHQLGFRLVEKPGELIPAVEEGLAAGGVQVVEVRTDRAENVEIHRQLTAAVHQALDAALGAPPTA